MVRPALRRKRYRHLIRRWPLGFQLSGFLLPCPYDAFHPEEKAIELKQLRYFVRIVDLGSFSRAAGEVHIAQSALSQHVAALEDELHTALLHRTARGVVPTDAGRLLYRHAQAMLKQAEEARSAVMHCTDEPSGTVVLGLPLSLAPGLALPILTAVRSRHPRVRLQVNEETSATILEWVKNGRLSAGLAFDDGNLDGLDVAPVFEERLFLVVPPKSALARRKLISLPELDGLELVVPSEGQGVRPRIERALAQAGLGPARVGVEANSLVLLKQAAAAGFGPTILGWPSFAAELAEGRLAAIEIARPAITRIAALCLPAATQRSLAIERVAATVAEVIREVALRSGWRGIKVLNPAAPPPSPD